MRYVLVLCLFVLGMPASADDSATHGQAFEAHSWEGRHSDELIAEWGKPKKVKSHGEGGKVLTYKLRFHGGEMIGDTVITWSEAGCDTDVWNSATPKVVATQKVKFYVDADGIVRGQVFSPRKWKNRRD